jgi:FlaA1/EpsC-like NDP-sugar epimerase
MIEARLTPEARQVAAPPPERRAAPRTLGRIGYITVLMLTDALAIGIAFVAAYHLYASMEPRPTRVPPIEEYATALVFLIGSLLATFALRHLYVPRRGISSSDQLGAIFVAITIGTVVAMATAAFTLRGLILPQTVLLSVWALSILTVWIARMGMDELARQARRRGLAPERLLVVGSGDEARAIVRRIMDSPELGYRIVGMVAGEGTPPPSPSPKRGEGNTFDSPLLGSLEDLPALLSRYGVGEVVIADPRVSNAEILDVVAACDRAQANVKVLPDVFHLVMREVGASEFAGLPMLQVRDVNLRGWNLLVKRAIDVVGAAVLLVLLAPLMVLVAVAVKLTSPKGPVFFIQERVGVYGRPVPCG